MAKKRNIGRRVRRGAIAAAIVASATAVGFAAGRRRKPPKRKPFISIPGFRQSARAVQSPITLRGLNPLAFIGKRQTRSTLLAERRAERATGRGTISRKREQTAFLDTLFGTFLQPLGF